MSDDPAGRLVALQQQALDLLHHVQELHRQLARDPVPHSDAERQLLHAFGQRDELSTRIGDAVIQLLATGVRVAPDLPRPPPPPPEPKEPTGPPAEPSSLAALARNGLGPSWAATSKPRPRSELLELVHEIGEPAAVDTEEAGRATVHRLVETVARMDEWLGFPRPDQQAMLGLVTSIARHVQDDSGVDLAKTEEDLLARTFSQMTRWSKHHLPGFVPGLSRSNGPDHATWLDDARHWWATLVGEPVPEATRTADEALERVETALRDGLANDALMALLIKEALDAGVAQSDHRLVGILADHPDLLQRLPGLKTLKGQVREVNRDEVEPVPVHDDADVPSDWPFLSLTEGRRAVMVGGIAKPHAAERVQRAFRFADVEWTDLDVRRTLTLADRVRAGSIDMIIALRSFLPHGQADAIRPACKEVDVPFCLVDIGYGVAQVRLAIERFCADLVDPA